MSRVPISPIDSDAHFLSSLDCMRVHRFASGPASDTDALAWESLRGVTDGRVARWQDSARRRRRPGAHRTGLKMQDLIRETFRGFIRIHLLHHAAEAPIFGVEMMEELRRHGYAMGPGTLYPLLHGLEESGLLRSTPHVVNGKVRRYYVCTPRGRKALDKLKARLKELTTEVLEDHPHHHQHHDLGQPAPARAPRRRTARATR